MTGEVNQAEKSCLFLCFTPRKLVEFSFITGEKSQRESDWSVCMTVFRSIRGLLEVVLTSVSFIDSQRARVILRLNLSGFGLLCCARFIKKAVLEVVNTLADAQSSKAFNKGLHHVQIPGKFHNINRQSTYNLFRKAA